MAPYLATLGWLAAFGAQDATQTQQQQNQNRQALEDRGRTTEDPTQQRQQRQQPQFQAPRLYRIEGKVLMAGGGGPPDRVTVHCVCAGVNAAKVTTDVKGAFGLQLGAGTSNGTPDASFGRSESNLPQAGNFSPEIEVRDCELQALLPGFRAKPYRLGMLQSGGGAMQALLILHPVENVSGYTFSGTSLNAPKDARKALEKGREAVRKGKAVEAEAQFRKAVALYRKYAVAWYELGRVLFQTGKNRDEAEKALRMSTAADAKYISPYPLLAQLALDAQRWEELAQHTATIIRLNPFFSEDVYVLSAQANLVLGRLDIAEAHAKEAVKMDVQFRYPVASRLLGRILLKQGRAQEAVAYLRSYSKLLPPESKDLEAMRIEIAAAERELR